MKSIKLRTRLTLLIVIVTIPIFAAIIFFISTEAAKLLKEDALENLRATNDSLDASVSQWLDAHETLLRQLTNLPDIVAMDAELQIPILQATACADQDLFLVQTVNLSGINVARNDNAAPKDYSDRGWFLGARAGNPVTTEALISRTTGNPALNMSMPIRDASGTIIGVVSIVSELDEVTAAVQASKIGNTGYAYVIDGLGHVIAHPDPSFSQELRDLSGYPPVVSLQDGVQGSIDFTDEEGVEWTAYVARLDNGWGVIVQQQRSELLNPLRFFQLISWTISLIGILVLVVGARLVICRAIDPIERLTETALAIADGDLDRTTPIVNADEIGMLANAFNRMTTRMHDLILSLEQRIKQQNQMQVELNSSLLRQTAILDNIPDLAWLKDEEGRFIAVNEPFRQVCGLAPADLVGKTDLDIWTEELAQKYRKDDLEVMHTEKRKHLEERLIDSQGQEKWIETIKTPIFDANGKLMGTAGIARDVTERKQAEDALKHSEEFTRSIVENEPECVKIVGPGGYLQYMNPSGLAMIEADSLDQVRGSSVYSIVVAEHRDAFRSLTKRVLRGEQGTLQFEIIGLRGTHRWLETHAVPLYDKNRKVESLLGITRDITERKRVEEALRESEQKFRAFIEQSSEGLVMTDEQGTVIEWNQAQEKLADLPRDQVIGKPLWDVQIRLLEPEKRTPVMEEKIRQMIHTALKEGDAPFLGRVQEANIHRRDGTKIVVQQTAFRIKTDQGCRLGSIAHDVTERKRVEALTHLRIRLFEFAENHPLEELLQKTLDEVGELTGSPIGFYHFVEADQKTLSLQAWSTRTLKEFCHTDAKNAHYYLDQAGVWADCIRERRIIIHNDYSSLANRRGLPEGHTTVIRELVVPIQRGERIVAVLGVGNKSQEYTDKDAEIVSYLADVTWELAERKYAEAEREKLITELEAKNAELERFTYTVSHDLKSPLVTISGFLGYMEQDAASGNTERLKKDALRIQEAVKKMQRLLHELLELSRIGRMMNASVKIPFNELVREGLEIVHGRLEERGVTVQVHPNLLPVYGDHPRLVEVLQNLLDNAVKYMGDQPDPRIEVGQRGEEDGLPVFFVRDNGMGIAPEHHERIFGLFNKLDAKSEGTGVGLALVKRIIEFHGGRVWVESEAGVGSTFLFTLPTGPVA